jgi:hypothetical protein
LNGVQEFIIIIVPTRIIIDLYGYDEYYLHVVQSSSGVHPTSYPMGAWDSFLGGKAGREADHSPPGSAEVKKMWIYTSTSSYALMVQCLIS